MSIKTTNLQGIFKELYTNNKLFDKLYRSMKPGYDPFIDELEEITLKSLKEQLCLDQ